MRGVERQRNGQWRYAAPVGYLTPAIVPSIIDEPPLCLGLRRPRSAKQHPPFDRRRCHPGQAGTVLPGARLRAAPGTGRGRPPRSRRSTPGRGRPVRQARPMAPPRRRQPRCAPPGRATRGGTRSRVPVRRSRRFGGAAGGPGPGQPGHFGDLVFVVGGADPGD